MSGEGSLYLEDYIFLMQPHIKNKGKQALLIFFYKALILFMKVESLKSKQLPKASSLNTIALGTMFQYMNFGGIDTFIPYYYLCLTLFFSFAKDCADSLSNGKVHVLFSSGIRPVLNMALLKLSLSTGLYSKLLLFFLHPPNYL
jgi:hypothetical protein